MNEEILTLALCITGAGEEERAYLSQLCAAEREKLETQLKKQQQPSQQNAFVCAAAWLAAADYFSGKGAAEAASWTAGEVSVHNAPVSAYAAAAENLRFSAKQLLEGQLQDEGFAFVGVKG